jgi:hypothetical protein
LRCDAGLVGADYSFVLVTGSTLMLVEMPPSEHAGSPTERVQSRKILIEPVDIAYSSALARGLDGIIDTDRVLTITKFT